MSASSHRNFSDVKAFTIIPNVPTTDPTEAHSVFRIGDVYMYRGREVVVKRCRDGYCATFEYGVYRFEYIVTGDTVASAMLEARRMIDEDMC